MIPVHRPRLHSAAASLVSVIATNFSKAPRASYLKLQRRDYVANFSSIQSSLTLSAYSTFSLFKPRQSTVLHQRAYGRSILNSCTRSISTAETPREPWAGNEPGIDVQNKDAWPGWRKRTVKVRSALLRYCNISKSVPFLPRLTEVMILVSNYSCRFLCGSRGKA